MRPLFFTATLLLVLSAATHSQDIASMINEVNLTRMTTQVRQLSGEDSTIVEGSTVRILNRTNNSSGNILAGDYLLERLSNMGLEVYEQQYTSNGRNIIATQTGEVYPDSIYIVCAHYDTRANYCADDNASGTIAVLEIARILSEYCFKNTILYALWDEEEIGLRGSRYFADSMDDNNVSVVEVLNMDMIAWDDDNDKQFDIDVRSIHGSNAIATLLTDLVTTYSLDIIPNIINPGTSASDHSSFWSNAYAAVLLGEAWSTGDFNDYYHTSGDRISEFNFPYFHELAKLSLAWTATVAEPVVFNSGISVSGQELTAQMSGVEYEWVDCNDGFSAIAGQTAQTFTATEDGSYAVVLSIGSCSEMSGCEDVLLTGIGAHLTADQIRIYPNPTSDALRVEFLNPEVPDNTHVLSVFSPTGVEIIQIPMSGQFTDLHLRDLPAGIYQLQINGPDGRAVRSFTKL